MQYIQVNENDRIKRRIYFHLVDATDGITPEIGEAGGRAKISLNGNTPTTSINSLVAIDSTNQPGTYYLELDPSEIQFPGIVVARYKSGNTAEFVALGQVMAFDPYTQYGQFSGGYSVDVDYKKIQKMIDEAIGKIVIPEQKEPDKFDYETLAKGFESVINEVKAITIPKTDLQPILSALEGLKSKVEAIKMPETDLNPVMERIDNAILITEDLLAEAKTESGQTAETVKKFLIKDTEAIKQSINELGEKLDNTQMVVLSEKPKKETKPKKSNLEEYLSL